MKKIMNFRIIVLLSILLFFTIYNLSGQIIDKKFFSDTTVGKIKRVYQVKKINDGILIAANCIENNLQKPVILKLNKLGNVVWSTLSTNNNSYDNASIMFSSFDDSYIYCIVKTYTNSVYSYKFWKVNSLNGNIIWSKPYLQTDNYSTFNIVDYDTSSFIIVNGNSSNGTKVMKLSKTTGDTISTKTLNLYGSHNLAVDENKNIYLSTATQLTKFNKDNLNLVLWQKDYTSGTISLDEIYKLYIDQYDDIYLFGRNGGSFGYGSGIIAKINPFNGSEVWKIAAAGGDLLISSYVDFNNKLYVSFRHALVGGNYYSTSCKVNKTNGNVEWNSNLNVTHLGQSTSSNGSSEAVLALDVDCNGNVFETGYYADANYGPGSWGILKLASSNGGKIYDLTITEDSTYLDTQSEGLGVCVFGNTPMIIGQEETVNGLDYNPLFVQLDPITGSITKRKYIPKNYLNPSKIIDIINNNDTIYLFKQVGKSINVSKNYNNNVIWEKTFSNTDYLCGGQMKLSDSIIFITACNLRTDSGYTYTSNVCNKYLMYKLSTKNGVQKNTKTLNFQYNYNVVQSLDLEVDKDTAYIFYQKDNQIFYHKWDSASLSTAKLLGTSGSISNFNGKKNIVCNYNDSMLLALNLTNIYVINKRTLLNNVLYNNSFQGNYFDILTDSVCIYLSGNNNSNQQFITAIDKQNMNAIWNKTYEPNGTIYKMDSDTNNYLYALGIKDSSIVVNKISKINGVRNWCYYYDSLSTLKHIPYDIKVNKQFNYLALTGSKVNINGTSDAIINIINLQKDTLFNYIGKEELNEQSKACIIEIYKDSNLLVGGTLNTELYSKSGFVFTINNPHIINTTSINELQKVSNIHIYPNPTNGIINIEGINEKSSIVLLDYTGKELLSKSNCFNKTINISHLNKGIYLLRIFYKNEQRTFKIIKY